MTRTCDDLGVCNGRHCHDVAACPDYDLIACNSGHCPEDDHHRMPCPHAVFECEVACSPEPARPTFPFAPGVIQRAPQGGYVDQDGAWLPLSLGETLKLLCVLAALSGLAGYLVEKFV